MKLDKLKGDVYKAAEVGNVSQLRALLELCQKDEVAEIVSAKTDGATPLIIACEIGHIEMVQYLIEECAADIEITDDDGETCLMISCKMGDKVIVKYLIDKGADVQRKDHNGNTALHHCWVFRYLHITANSTIEIMKLLVQCKAQMEKYGMTPLLLAAANGEEDVVNYCISLIEIERTEKIDALELLGATCMSRYDMTRAYTYWKLAMEERFRDGFHVIEKPMNQQPNAAYENTMEVKTLNELDGLISDPDAMQMHALVVRERILGPAHDYTILHILKCGANYADLGSLDKCLRLWTYAWDIQQKFSIEALHWQMEDILLLFANLFSSMLAHEPHHIDFDIIIGILDKSVNGLERSKNADLEIDSYILIIVLYIIGIMCRIQESFSEEQVYQFENTVYKFVKLNLRDSRGYTPLHLTCDGNNFYMSTVKISHFVFPYKDVVKILIKVGASVNAKDNEYGDTPLHVAGKSDMLFRDCLMAILHENGAHIDATNLEGKTPMGLSYQKDNKIVKKYQTLKCLASKVIVANHIPYKRIVSKEVEDFVTMH